MLALIAALAALTLPDSAGAAIHVMRHLDTPEGERDPDLTAAGKARAEKLRSWFDGKPLDAIYVSDFLRTRQTAAPLASARRIAVTVYDPADTTALVARVRAETGSVLIVGHSNTVPDIVEQLGGARPAPLDHPDFGDIWTIENGATDKGFIASHPNE